MNHSAFSQDSLVYKLKLDSVLLSGDYRYGASSDYIIEQSPQEEDRHTLRKYGHLRKSKVTEKNFDEFYRVSNALWQMGQEDDAERMLLQVIESKAPFYSATYYHPSDVPGDGSSTSGYGYGSFSSNYKNGACIRLAKLYIRQQRFAEALKYIELANKEFKVEYTCGTGYRAYQTEIQQIYGLCYEGLGRYRTVVDFFISEFSDHYNAILIRAIKKLYTPEQIRENLKIAETSVSFTIHPYQSLSGVIYNYGEPSERTVVSNFTSGDASTTLFGYQISLMAPQLKDGEIITKERFIEYFKQSGFYQELLSAR